jgi:nucleotide-binding universal stress UspA family protein
MFGASGMTYGIWMEDRRAEMERAAREAVETLPAHVAADVTVLDGDPVTRLAEASDGLDLLVLGSRRYGPVRTTLLGGVSSPLIERAACPLVIVPRGVHGHAHEPEPARAAADALR